MKLPIPFLSAIELAINTWLKLDDDALPRFKELEGKIICFHITDIDTNLYFLPASSGIQVLGNYPDAEEGGLVDATIHGSILDLVRLSTSKNAGETMLKSDVEVEGEMHTAEKFSAILQEIDINWEELLSHLVGNTIAHGAAQAGREAASWFGESGETLKQNTKEYLTKESDLSPNTEEINHFIDQVDNTREDVDRLQARIQLLQSQTTK